MNAYDLEKQNLSMRMFLADEKLRQLTTSNTEMAGMIEKLHRHENNREKELIGE